MMRIFHLLSVAILFAFCFIHLIECQQENNFERQVIELCNIERSKAGLPPLRFNQELFVAARNYAKLMETQNFFSHTGQDGSTPEQRVRAARYTGQPGGENIAKGQTTPERVVSDWMNSAGHKANILGSGYNEIGVGESGNLWVQNFGFRNGAPAAEPTPRQAPAPAPTPRQAPAPAPTPRQAPAPAPTPRQAPAPAPTPRQAPAPAPGVVITPQPSARPAESGNGVSIFYFQGRKFELFKTKVVGQLDVNNPSGKPFQVNNQAFTGKDWSAKFFGYFIAPVTGVYHFQTISDDGVVLTLGGERLIKNWTTHKPVANNSGAVQLTAGAAYSLKVEYFNAGAGATLHVLYQTPGSDNFVRLPPNVLVPDNAATQSS